MITHYKILWLGIERERERERGELTIRNLVTQLVRHILKFQTEIIKVQISLPLIIDA